jgi:hypothetical protein
MTQNGNAATNTVFEGRAGAKGCSKHTSPVYHELHDSIASDYVFVKGNGGSYQTSAGRE